jgi:endonuclease/exonuclease/phosphatase family metal-dependent hydrolase
MSFNIRYGTAADGENNWPQRRELVFDVIREHDPDVLGVQEALRFQLDEIGAAVPGYGELGVGRDDGREAGEYAAIMYRADRFEVSESGTFWFSSEPDVVGSIDWGAHLPRICTWARLVEKSSGRAFYVFNVHFDHQSQESRERSAELLVERIEARAQADPVVVTGDFNADEDNPAMLYLLGAEGAESGVGLRDSFRVVHPDAVDVGTFNGFEGRTAGPKIDAILVSGNLNVESAAIVRTSRDGRYPSDHFPVVAVVNY